MTHVTGLGLSFLLRVFLLIPSFLLPLGPAAMPVLCYGFRHCVTAYSCYAPGLPSQLIPGFSQCAVGCSILLSGLNFHSMRDERSTQASA